MASYEVGEFIRRQRLARGLTQEQLADGVCSTVTLSRIENSKQAPNKNQIDRLIQKLGLNAEKFINVFLSVSEYDSFEKKEMLSNYLRKFDIESAKKMITELENDKEFLNSLSLQFLLRAKANILLNEGCLDESLDLLNQAINITISSFDEMKIKTYLLTFDEIVIIDMIAIVYSDMGKMRKAIEILYDLKASVDRTYVDLEEKSRTYPMIIYHLTKFLGLSRRYKEAISLCDEGSIICIRHNKLELLPYITYNKACDLYELGETEPCQELFTQVYYSLKLVGEITDAKMVKEKAIENYGFEIR